MAENTEVLGNFIAIEGLDGSGTTTQLNMLEEEFRKKNIPAHTTCEPSSMPPGRLIRKILRKEEAVEPETLARLFSADRYEHLYNREDGIIAHLRRGETVITDRYLFSSLAYQSPECGFDFVLSLNPYPLPEYLIYIELTPEICQMRMKNRDQEELFDSLKIQQDIISNYEKAMAVFSGKGMKTTKIDGSKTPEEICGEILKFLGR